MSDGESEINKLKGERDGARQVATALTIRIRALEAENRELSGRLDGARAERDALTKELGVLRIQADRDRGIASACGEAICSVEYDGYHSDACLNGRAEKAEAEVERHRLAAVDLRNERDALKAAYDELWIAKEALRDALGGVRR